MTGPADAAAEAAADPSVAASVVDIPDERPTGSRPVTIDEEQWAFRVAAHEARVDTWIRPALERRSRAVSDPVEDFLFDYYPYSPARLRQWSPGVGRVLTGPRSESFLQRPGFRRSGPGVVVDARDVPGVTKRLPWVRQMLRRTDRRPAAFHCFGMHEWAMVHGLRQQEVRHSSLPLRVSPDTVLDTVAGVGLRCTHFDAYRFFTDSARPLNTTTPTRDAQPSLEQPGCLHATMDLYKYAMWLEPVLPAELKADAFDLARRCRVVDMRASPYDVEVLGLRTIPVETTAGRVAYVEQQRAFAADGRRLRERMLAELDVAAPAPRTDDQDDARRPRSLR